MAQLGRLYGSGRLAHIEELAQAESIPANYLVQILNELRNGSLVSSKRGKQGGYTLARSPEQITLRDIVRVIDTELLDSQPGRNGQSGALVAQTWEAIGTQMDEALQAVTLQKMMPDTGSMYYI